MGYTHYFKLKKGAKISNEKIKNLKREIKTVLKEHKNILCFESYREKNDLPPFFEIDKDNEFIIRFNGKVVEKDGGIIDNGYETFYFDSKKLKNGRSEACKTNRKNYDIVICKVLLILKNYYGKSMELDSDGFSYYNSYNYNIGDFVLQESIDGVWYEASQQLISLGYNIVFKITKIRGKNDDYIDYEPKFN